MEHTRREIIYGGRKIHLIQFLCVCFAFVCSSFIFQQFSAGCIWTRKIAKMCCLPIYQKHWMLLWALFAGAFVGDSAKLSKIFSCEFLKAFVWRLMFFGMNYYNNNNQVWVAFYGCDKSLIVLHELLSQNLIKKI